MCGVQVKWGEAGVGLKSGGDGLVCVRPMSGRGGA